MERRSTRLRDGWKFRLYGCKEAPDGVWEPSLDDSDWEMVCVPHDWAINGEFKEDNDFSYCAIEHDVTPHSGRTGALPIIGTGVYRRVIHVGKDAENVSLEFDGIMWEADVYVNGEHVFFSHYGYMSFSADITGSVTPGGDALVCVVATVYPDCSRWYPGAGIYRNVRLVEKSASYIRYSGLRLTQNGASPEKAVFSLETDASSDGELELTVTSPGGEEVFRKTYDIISGTARGTAEIPSPVFWSPSSPYLYTVRAVLVKDGIACDEASVKTGVRTAFFDRERGFILNGEQTKIKGVCLHHDHGALGAALSVPALRRQIGIMKEMGINSVRTSHNPPAPELLNICDEEGILVMDEMFDEWKLPKVANGYAKYFDAHAADDIRSIIYRDINHPSVIIWSAGNELREQKVPEGKETAEFMARTVRSVDPSRQVCACFDDPVSAFENGLGECFDAVGMNYKPHLYEELHEKYPSVALIGSETASTISTRGVYHLPAEIHIPALKHEDLTISAYDLEAPFWAQNPEKEWAAQDRCSFVAGEYVWTGFDYLGEPTPYYSEWPARSSYFGITDTAGDPKNRYYGYKARWTDTEVLHVFPHWNWEGHEGENVPVHVFTSYPSAELFINGKSYGVRSFGDETELSPYRLVWNDAVYEPGEVKVTAYDAEGNIAAEASVRTAGKSERIVLRAERKSIVSDGEDLVYVTASVTDGDGNVCPHFSGRLFFEIEGEGEIAATDSGDPRDTESFARSDKRALSGLCTVIVRSFKDRPGNIILSVSGEGLEGDSVTVASLGK